MVSGAWFADCSPGIGNCRRTTASTRITGRLIRVPHIPEEEGLTVKVGMRNRLEGEVTRIHCGTVMCLVEVRLAGGAAMESVMTRDSFDGLGIKSGDTVHLAVSALNVLLLKE